MKFMFFILLTNIFFFSNSTYAQKNTLQGIYMTNALKLVQCTQAHEWDAAKRMRQKYFFDNVPMQDPYTWTFNDPKHFHVVLYNNTTIVGYAHLQRWPESRAALRILVIDIQFRNQGYGGKFLELCEQWLQQKGFKSIHTESSAQAYSFYKQYGYQEMPFNDPDGYVGDPQDIPMGKILIY
jgi:N-acetylglutamate synthase-like GNAT family acetyltransferase